MYTCPTLLISFKLLSMSQCCLLLHCVYFLPFTIPINGNYSRPFISHTVRSDKAHYICELSQGSRQHTFAIVFVSSVDISQLPAVYYPWNVIVNCGQSDRAVESHPEIISELVSGDNSPESDR